jgi:hypothetical protein
VLPLPFVARVRAIRLLRPGARAVLPLEPGELEELLRRREELLVEDERRAVEAALAGAGPAERVELERLLGRAPGATRGAPEASNQG